MRRRTTAGTLTLEYNIGDVAYQGATTQSTFASSNTLYADVQQGDGILVLAMAPSNPGGGNPIGHPIAVSDTAGNTYTQLSAHAFEANPPNVNEGVYATLWWCPASIADLGTNFDHVNAVWDHAVFDRLVYVWAVRHKGGAATPVALAATADHDAAAFAAGQVTLVAPAFTPSRDEGMYFAIIIAVKTGGIGTFQGVPGFNGFFQAQFHLFHSVRQDYFTPIQTSGADVFLIVGPTTTQHEDDIGLLPGGVTVPSFSGVGQLYGAGTNAWKGIILLGLE